MMFLVISLLYSAKHGDPNLSVKGEQVSSYRKETCPNPRIDLPFLAVGSVELIPSFPIKADNGTLYIA